MTAVAETNKDLQPLEEQPKNKGEKLLTPEDFIKATIKTPKGTAISVKPISPHFFRVNFIKKTGEGLEIEYRITESALVEVIETKDGMALVDHTKR